MDLILRGTMQTNAVNKQTNLFETEDEDDVLIQEVNLDQLCNLFPRLALVREIAKQNHFMHWELEFADLFAERGGFDLVIGNPPWVLLRWDETGVLADSKPMFVVKKSSAIQTAGKRTEALKSEQVQMAYYSEYETISGEQNFFNAVSLYPTLIGMKANLYKCFLPQGWQYANRDGICAFVHPEGVYNDPKGDSLRRDIYRRLKKHFQFENELNLFEGTNDHGRMKFSLNIYRNGQRSISFETISNLFSPSTIEASYDWDGLSTLEGIKDAQGNWNLKGHPDRILRITKKELALFAKLFDDSENWECAKLPIIHAQSHVDVLTCFSSVRNRLSEYVNELASTTFWNETNAQDDKTLVSSIGFPESCSDEIYVGAYCGIANPCFQTVRKTYNSSNITFPNHRTIEKP